MDNNDAAEKADIESTDRETALCAGRNGHVATIGSCRVFVDTDRYSAALINALSNGAYENRERALIKTLLKPTDRVLEIGTAVGVVTMTAAQVVGPENVVTYDANALIVADARRNFAYNGLDRIESRVGALFNRQKSSSVAAEVPFSISKDFWGSRLRTGPSNKDIIDTVLVPSGCLEDQIQAHQATMLMCDIEGGEVDLFLDADLTGIRLIIMEVHDWIGVQETDMMIRYLITNGFSIDLKHSGGNVAVLCRR